MGGLELVQSENVVNRMGDRSSILTSLDPSVGQPMSS